MVICPICRNETSEDEPRCKFCGSAIETSIVRYDPQNGDDIIVVPPQQNIENVNVPKEITRWRGKPLAQGVVESITENNQSVNLGKGLVDGITSLISPMGGGGRGRSAIQSHLRIRDAAGNVFGAIIEGEYSGPPIEQGDLISIWGYKRDNVIHIKLVYNHNLSISNKVK